MKLQVDYGISIDKRDRVFMPTDGSIITFNQEFPIYADKSFITNTLSSSSYKSFGKYNMALLNFISLQ